jgi:riboflavin kinase / FMN adenylyltransferase
MPTKIEIFADELFTPQGKGPAVTTVGTFDGVHVGHQKILSRLNHNNTGTLVRTVVTFEPHPQLALKDRLGNVPILTTISEKIALLRSIGIDRVFILKFTPELAELSAEIFLKLIILEKLCTRRLTVGYNHSFGKGRKGNLDYLRSVATTYGFELETVAACYIDDEVVSSTKIRRALQNGDVNRAATFLSRPYFISGEVVAGQKVGRTLHFPTANLRILHPEKLTPAGGVYAVAVNAMGGEFPGMVNIGNRPTIYGDQAELSTFEVHLIGFTGDLYGKLIGVHFLKRLRDELKFNSTEALIRQLKSDEEESVQTYQNYQKSIILPKEDFTEDLK